MFVTRRNPRKIPFYFVSRQDNTALLYIRFVGNDNAAGDPVTSATVEVTGNNLLTFRINGSPEGMNTYPGASGGPGEIPFVADFGFFSPGLVQAVINGTFAGMPKPQDDDYNIRWRADVGDVAIQQVIGGGTPVVNLAQTECLLGERHPGVAIFPNVSNIGVVPLFSGRRNKIVPGTNQLISAGTIPGSGKLIGDPHNPPQENFYNDSSPDLLADIPGSSTTAGFDTNVPDRQYDRAIRESAIRGRNITTVVTRAHFVGTVGTNASFNIHDASPIVGTRPLFYAQPGAGANWDSGKIRVKSKPGQIIYAVLNTGSGGSDGELQVNGYYEHPL